MKTETDLRAACKTLDEAIAVLRGLEARKWVAEAQLSFSAMSLTLHWCLDLGPQWTGDGGCDAPFSRVVDFAESILIVANKQ